jgi:predicted ATPase
VDEATVGPVLRIYRALNGMPLAFELAGARVRALSPQQIAARLGAGKIRFQVIKASPDLVKVDDTVAMTSHLGQKALRAPRGGLPIPHSLVP